eukprot:3096049-Rhodomonas_salina.3
MLGLLPCLRTLTKARPTFSLPADRARRSEQGCQVQQGQRGEREVMHETTSSPLEWRQAQAMMSAMFRMSFIAAMMSAMFRMSFIAARLEIVAATAHKGERGGHLAVGTVEGCTRASDSVYVFRRELGCEDTDEAVAIRSGCEVVACVAHRQGGLSSTRRFRWAGSTRVILVRVRSDAAAKPSLRAGAAKHLVSFCCSLVPGAQTPIERCGVVEHALHRGNR